MSCRNRVHGIAYLPLVALGALLPLLVTHGSCGLCSERVIQTTGWMAVGQDEACPDVEEGHSLHHSGQLMSVDGDGEKTVLTPAGQRCCYSGSFVYKGSAVAMLCRYRHDDAVPDEGDVQLCPGLADATRGDFWWYPPTREIGSGAPAEQVEVIAIELGPSLGSVTPRRWKCDYPVTVRKTADVCG